MNLGQPIKIPITSKLSVIKTIWLKLLLSSQNPVTISHAFMSVRDLRNCVIDLIVDNLGEISNQMKNRIHGRCFNINDFSSHHLLYCDANAVTQEMQEKNPELVKNLLSIMLRFQHA